MGQRGWKTLLSFKERRPGGGGLRGCGTISRPDRVALMVRTAEAGAGVSFRGVLELHEYLFETRGPVKPMDSVSHSVPALCGVASLLEGRCWGKGEKKPWPAGPETWMLMAGFSSPPQALRFLSPGPWRRSEWSSENLRWMQRRASWNTRPAS